MARSPKFWNNHIHEHELRACLNVGEAIFKYSLCVCGLKVSSIFRSADNYEDFFEMVPKQVRV